MMQLSRIVIVTNLISVISVNAFLDIDIINGYFRKKSLNYGSIIGCFSKKEQLRVTKKIMLGPMVRVLNINKANIDSCLQSRSYLGVILDGDCSDSRNFLRLSGERGYFDDRHHWLIVTSTEQILDLFDNVQMFINANIHIIYPDKTSKPFRNYTIENVYNPSKPFRNYIIENVYNPSYQHGGTVKFQKMGFYNIEEGYNIKEQGCKYWMRKNMTGITLKTIVVLPVPFNGKLLDYLGNDDNREINTFNRFHYSVLSSCQRYYNFSAEVTLSKSWGYKQKDGTFDGLVGALERNQVDYGASPLFVKTPRIKVLQYGRKTWTLRAAFIFRNPKSVNSIDGFVRPLPLSMWSLTAVSAVLLMIFLRMSCLYEKKNVHQHVDASWSYSTLCTIGALCQQGMIATPHFPSGRIVTLFLFLFALLIYQFYSASLVSHLLMKSPTRITSVDDILRSNMKVGCEDVLYNRDYFKYTTDNPSKKLYFDKILGDKNNSNFLPPEEGVELVRGGQYAFHVELATAYPIIRSTYGEKAVCELREVQLFRDQPMHANYQRDSPFKEMFDTCLQRVAEVGILAREVTFWHPTKPECIQSSKSVTFNIGLDDFYPTLMILGMGIVCSLVVLTIEVYIFRAGGEKPLHPFVE